MNAAEKAYKFQEANASRNGITLTRSDWCVAAHTAIRVLQAIQSSGAGWIKRVAISWILRELEEWREENGCGNL